MIPAQNCFEPVALPAKGARLRAAQFPADNAVQPRGVCVLLNGQTEFIEKYFEVIDELRGRGFAVVTLDWRGQGGSGRLVPETPLAAHIHDFEDYDADLGALMDQLVTPMLTGSQRPIALAHSMGGHILLRYLHRNPHRFAAAAFSAPMLMFSTRGAPRWPLHLVTGWKIASGHAKDIVWGMSKRDPLTLTFEQQIVTSDPVRFQRTKDFLAVHPALRLGAPTWGWVAAALRSIRHLAQRSFAARIPTPVLICGAGQDLVCITADTARFAAAMPHCRYLEIAGTRHEILMERDVFRTQFWTEFDQFIAPLTPDVC
jgi:lysophospholipase